MSKNASRVSRQVAEHNEPRGRFPRVEVGKHLSHMFLGQVLSRTYTDSARTMANAEDTRKTVLITG